MWPQVAEPVPSIWEPQVRALATQRVLRDERPKVVASAPPRAKRVAAPTCRNAPTEDLMGVVMWFKSISCVMPLPPLVNERAGFDHAQLCFLPGAFDRSLRRCRPGNVDGAVRFEFSHIDATATGGTRDGTLKLWADDVGLYFYVTGSTRDGRNSVKWARTFKELREMSCGALAREYTAVPAHDEEPNTLLISRADLFEISLVKHGAFPRTEVRFL